MPGRLSAYTHSLSPHIIDTFCPFRIPHVFILRNAREFADSEQTYNNGEVIVPLRKKDNLSVDKWFGHGYKTYPPRDRVFMKLPSGGTLLVSRVQNQDDDRCHGQGLDEILICDVR